MFRVASIPTFRFVVAAQRITRGGASSPSSFAPISKERRNVHRDRNAISLLPLRFHVSLYVAGASRGELGAVHRRCDGFAFLRCGDADFRVLAWPATHRYRPDSGVRGDGGGVLTHVNCVLRSRRERGVRLNSSLSFHEILKHFIYRRT